MALRMAARLLSAGVSLLGEGAEELRRVRSWPSRPRSVCGPKGLGHPAAKPSMGAARTCMHRLPGCCVNNSSAYAGSFWNSSCHDASEESKWALSLIVKPTHSPVLPALTGAANICPLRSLVDHSQSSRTTWLPATAVVRPGHPGLPTSDAQLPYPVAAELRCGHPKVARGLNPADGRSKDSWPSASRSCGATPDSAGNFSSDSDVLWRIAGLGTIFVRQRIRLHAIVFAEKSHARPVLSSQTAACGCSSQCPAPEM